jgi:hypothetical protein
MICTALIPILRYSLIWLIAMGMAISVIAGVALPPMPDKNDTNAMAQYWIKVNYDAQKSQQEKLRVGLERYEKSKVKRAIILQAMAAELAGRQAAIVIPSKPSASYVANDSNTWIVTVLGAAVIGLSFLGFRYYLNRLDAKDSVISRKQ